MTSKTEWWEESAVFHLPGVESRDIPELVKPCAVLIHGIDGKTNPQLLDTDELLQVVDQDLKLTFSYDRTRVVDETASEETILQVAADLLEFLRENAGCVKGGDVDPLSFMFFAYDLGGSIIKQVDLRSNQSRRRYPN
ncbi:hypothetical protein COL26b_001943 [Colletotrichum chrysophilum]|uniref:uncharacterized protein n=1 Tax=Colletotrichum chrysophilum TaxID=1836956 RepID=UPI002300EA7D|nr:uncharacterized protein COL26b_001943 [Colletotrichum chrysophilum]KAJ0379792.1 hypothetical protein COL26b_001943 [Colletotrichum chrysophilum]